MTNAIANPIIPNIIRKSKNSCFNDFFTGVGDDSATVRLYYILKLLCKQTK